jgi:hypothetical protein
MAKKNPAEAGSLISFGGVGGITPCAAPLCEPSSKHGIGKQIFEQKKSRRSRTFNFFWWSRRDYSVRRSALRTLVQTWNW